MKRRITILALAAAISSFGLVGFAAPAHASCESITDVQCIVFQDACRVTLVQKLFGC